MANNVVTLKAVGDIALSDHPLLYGWGVRSSMLNGSDPFKDVKHLLKGGDIVTGNLECPLGVVKESYDLIDKSFIGDITFAHHLSDAGFNVVNIANNHIMHHGDSVYHKTQSALKKENILTIGGDGKQYNSSEIIECNGIRTALIGYSMVKERRTDNPRYNYNAHDKLIDLIRTMKTRCEYVVLSIHWGVEDIDKPHPDIVEYARHLCDTGVDVILGHHPHVLQAIESYNNSLIFYSLGNFIFDCLWSKKYRLSLIANIYINDNGVSFDITPVYICRDYHIKVLYGRRRKKAIAYIQSISRVNYFFQGHTIGKDKNIDKFNHELKRREIFLQVRKLTYLVLNIYRIKKDTIIYLARKVLSMS